jgi:hypothetical protein
MQDLAKYSIILEISRSGFDSLGSSDKEPARECRVPLNRYSQAAKSGEESGLVMAVYDAVGALVDGW